MDVLSYAWEATVRDKVVGSRSDIKRQRERQIQQTEGKRQSQREAEKAEGKSQGNMAQYKASDLID